jgi:hypothetical protein
MRFSSTLLLAQARLIGKKKKQREAGTVRTFVPALNGRSGGMHPSTIADAAIGDVDATPT